MFLRSGFALTSVLALSFSGIAAHAEEGMWTFDNPPTKLLQEHYGFTPTQAMARPCTPFERATE